MSDYLPPPDDVARRRALSRARQSTWRRAQLELFGLVPSRSRARKASVERRFVGVDGEGGGTDAAGRQHYTLLVAGDRALKHPDGSPLGWAECLEFICEAIPPEAIAVSFAFEYDATQIIRTMPPRKVKQILEAAEDRRLTYLGAYYVEYRPRRFFRVGRVGENGRAVKGSARTIYDTFGLFQSSFANALDSFQIGTKADRDAIRAMKLERAGFDGLTADIVKYCRQECAMLAALMETFRRLCAEGGIVPDTWAGAGRLAAALHKKHASQRHHEGARDRDALAWLNVVPEGARHMTASAYYGGRFETSLVGRYHHAVYSHDIRSAYPDAMRRLPCMRHARWTLVSYDPTMPWWVGPVTFDHPAALRYCGLPVRSPDGRLQWPRAGSGVYWSCEIAAARRLGATVRGGRGWAVTPACDCHPYSWVEELFNYRKKLQRDHGDAAGIPIKLGINALYGQLARRAGGPGPWSHPAHAGMITAMTRARLLEATAAAPDTVLYLATDGIIATAPLQLDIGPALGQWEYKEHPGGVFIVQPGLYWGAGAKAVARKGRGLPPAPLNEAVPALERAWRDWMDMLPPDRAGGPGAIAIDDATASPPEVNIFVHNFIGVRLALARGRLETAGRWTSPDIDPPRSVSFDWRAKRTASGGVRAECGGYIRTMPWRGSQSIVSVPYVPLDGESAGLSHSLGDECETTLDAVVYSPPRFDGSVGQA